MTNSPCCKWCPGFACRSTKQNFKCPSDQDLGKRRERWPRKKVNKYVPCRPTKNDSNNNSNNNYHNTIDNGEETPQSVHKSVPPPAHINYNTQSNRIGQRPPTAQTIINNVHSRIGQKNTKAQDSAVSSSSNLGFASMLDESNWTGNAIFQALMKAFLNKYRSRFEGKKTIGKDLRDFIRVKFLGEPSYENPGYMSLVRRWREHDNSLDSTFDASEEIKNSLLMLILSIR